jgi:hypothetical protein
MRSAKSTAVAIAVACIASLFAATAASAGVVTIGSPLKGSFSWPGEVTLPTTYVNARLADPTAPLVSPVDGAVIRWRLSEGFIGGPFQLEVIRPGGEGDWGVGGPLSAPVPGSGPSFATDLPIKKGEGIALNAGANAFLGTRLSPATKEAAFVEFTPQLTPANNSAQFSQYIYHQEVGFNADVLPAPTVGGISTASGPATGGTKVTISGTDFAKVTKVSFGATAAASYKVESETRIVATAPPGKPSTTVGVSVTTLAGTAKAPTRFAYAAAPKAAKPGKGKGKQEGKKKGNTH